MIARSPRAPVDRRIARSATASRASSENSSSTPSSSNSRLVLLDQGVLGFGQDAYEGFLVEVAHAGDDRQPADELGDHAELEQVLRHDVGEDVSGLALGLGVDRRR